MNTSELFLIGQKAVTKKNTISPGDIELTESCTLEHENEDEKVESKFYSEALINQENNENFVSSCKKIKNFARKAKAILFKKNICPIEGLVYVEKKVMKISYHFLEPGLEYSLPNNFQLDKEFPKNVKEDQEFPEFMNFSKRQSGSYISYKQDGCNFKLDDGSKFPEQKFFLETHFDFEKRIFTGWIDWTMEPTLRGGIFWQYKIEFSQDFQKIIGGFSVTRNESGEIIDRSNYRTDLIYELYQEKSIEQQKQQIDEKDEID